MFLTPDEMLIHSILQGGLKSYYAARSLGVRQEILFDEARTIWLLFERMSASGRLPSLTEIRLVTGHNIPAVHSDPLDITLCAEKLVKRGLSGQLNEMLGSIMQKDQINVNPTKVRDSLTDVVKETAWSYGEPYSLNTRSSLDELVEHYARSESRRGGLQGLSSPWPTMDLASLGLQNGELTVVFAKRKVGKCIEADTMLYSPSTGLERTIKELQKDCVNDYRRLDWNVHTWKKNSPIYKTHPNDIMALGEKECVEITYRSGRTMTVGVEHPMLTPRGWVKAQDLIVGHHNGSSVFMPAPTKPDEGMTDCEVKFLAYMIAEGGCTNPLTPTFTSSVPELVDEMRECSRQIGCELRPAKNQPYNYYVIGKERASIREGISGTTVALRLLREHGLMEKKSSEKVIPPRLFSLTDHQLGLFLGRLWSCDGSVERSGIVSYSTGSKRMATQVQHLLLRFGVTSRVCTIKRKTKAGDQDYYEIYIHRRTIERFKANIKLIGPKAKKIQEVFFQGRDRVGFLKNEEIHDLVYAELESSPELLQDIGEELGYSFKFQKGHIFDSKSGRVRRRVFSAFCDVFGSELNWILDENLWWDEISSITSVGKKQCYDLSIPETECYLANDFIVHNSWMVIVWAVHMWKHDLKPGEKILFVTMEMTPLQVLRRMACVDLHLGWDDFRGGRLTSHEKTRLTDWVDKRMAAGPEDSNIVIVGSNQVRTIKDLSAVVGEHKPKAVVVDSFYILGRASGASIYERVLANVQGMKLDIALKHNVPVLASTQLKGTTNKDVLTADSDDAMGAKAIGDYADVTRGLFVDAEYKAAGQRLWRGMEAREFVGRDVKINFNFRTMDFSEIEEIDPGDESGRSNDGDGPDDSDPPPFKQPTSGPIVTMDDYV